jgi:hypothetical protein
MKKYVFTIKDDVCAANGKDVNATELLAKMKLWGDVTDYDKATAQERAEYQTVVDSLTAQLGAIKAQELTDDEIVLLNAYRECKAKNAAVYDARIDELEGQLDDIRIEEQQRVEQIIALLQR